MPTELTEKMVLPTRRTFLKTMAGAGLAGILFNNPLVAMAAALSKGKSTQTGQKCPAMTLPAATPFVPLVPKTFDDVPTRVDGLSKGQIVQHVGLYTNYVKGYNTTMQALIQACETKSYDAIRDLQLKLTFNLNGATLHDWYFSNLGHATDAGVTGPQALTLQWLTRDFGSLEAYYADLKAVAGKMRGWTMTVMNKHDGRLMNVGFDAHDVGTPLMSTPLLVLDVYEHAYMIDFGTNRGAYLEKFVANVNWAVVEERAKAALAHQAWANSAKSKG